MEIDKPPSGLSPGDPQKTIDQLIPDAIPDSIRWGVIALCALVCLMDGFDMVVAPIAVPLMAADWELAPDAFSFALAAAVLGSGIGAAFIAPIGDRIGRRPMILINFAILGLSCLAVAFTTNVYQMIPLRFLTGLGMGASIANALALVSEYSPDRLRSRVVAGVYAMSAVGGAFGGFFSPLIIQHYGWQGIYAFGGFIPLLFLMVLFFGLAESHRFLILPSANRDAGSTAVASESVVTQAQVGGMLQGLKSLFSPSLRAPTTLLWLLYFFSMFTTYMITTWLPTLLTLAGWNAGDASQGITAFSIGGVFGGLFLGWLVDRGMTRGPLILGFGSTAIAVALLLIVPGLVPLWLALILVMGAGTVGVSYALAAVAAHVYPTQVRAGGIGTAAAAGRVGATLAPVIGGLLLAAGFSAIQMLTSLIVPMVIALVIVQLFSRKLNLTKTG